MNTMETANWKRDTQPSTAAIIAGLSLLAMAVIAAYANFGVIMNLEVPGDPSTTAANLVESAGQARLAAAGFIIVVMIIFLPKGLYGTVIEIVSKRRECGKLQESVSHPIIG